MLVPTAGQRNLWDSFWSTIAPSDIVHRPVTSPRRNASIPCQWLDQLKPPQQLPPCSVGRLLRHHSYTLHKLDSHARPYRARWRWCSSSFVSRCTAGDPRGAYTFSLTTCHTVSRKRVEPHSWLSAFAPSIPFPILNSCRYHHPSYISRLSLSLDLSRSFLPGRNVRGKLGYRSHTFRTMAAEAESHRREDRLGIPGRIPLMYICKYEERGTTVGYIAYIADNTFSWGRGSVQRSFG